MAVSNKDNPKAERPVEQATAAPGEKRSVAARPAEPVDAQDRGKPGSEPEQPQRPGGVDGAADQAEARAAAEPTPVHVSGVPVAESSDPAVHQLMAERETARINGDDQAIKDIDKRLGDAGYRVG
jgi:hypothetical protein